MIDDESSAIDEKEWAAITDFIVDLSEAYGWDLTEEDEEAAWDFFYQFSHDDLNWDNWVLDLKDFENVVVDSSNFIVSRIE